MIEPDAGKPVVDATVTEVSVVLFRTETVVLIVTHAASVGAATVPPVGAATANVPS